MLTGPLRALRRLGTPFRGLRELCSLVRYFRTGLALYAPPSIILGSLCDPSPIARALGAALKGVPKRIALRGRGYAPHCVTASLGAG